jgi:thiol-disulfide isomerase/thioredoxin
MASIPQIILTDVKSGDPVTISAADRNFKRLFIFLRPGDCTACLGEVPLFSRLQKLFDNDQLQQYIVVVDSTEREAKSFLESYNPRATVLLDKTNSVQRKVGMANETPVTVLVDGAFDVLIAQGPTGDVEAQKRFVSQVQAIASDRSPSGH